MRRVAVTGLGLVTPFGIDPSAFWDGLREGRSTVRAIDPVDGLDGETPLAAPVTGFAARDHVDPKSLRLMAPAVAYGVAAAQVAVADSGVATGSLDPVRFGVFVGSRGHSSDRQDLLAAVRRSSADGSFSLARFGAEGLPLVHPMWLLKGLANNVLYFVSLKYNAQGMNNNISMGGVGGTMAIGEAFEAVRRGHLDVALAGGYDSAIDLDRLETFRVPGLMSVSRDPATASQPFDRHRDGFIPGEGAGFLVLEPLDAAVARGATLYGEVRGYGAAAAPASRAALGPSARGFALALSAALDDAQRPRPDAVFAHGLATRDGDAEETLGLIQVLGDHARTMPVPALTSILGNSFAAFGVLQAAAALFALRDGLVPPTIHLTAHDPACDLDYVSGTSARAVPLRTVALNNANLGGAHAALVLERID
jgi:3-oxoacyl-[acyl-carrier-protein] synthase II